MSAKLSRFLPHFKVEQLQNISDQDTEFEKEILELFSDQFNTTYDKLKASLEEEDTGQAFLFAHDLKGSSANVGAESISSIAFEIEALSKKGDFKEATEKLPSLLTAFKETEKAFKEYTDSLEE